MSAGKAEKHDRQSIYEALRKEISSGTLEPGVTLKEVALSQRFGVSRTPVRDALMRLTEDGLLERTQRGLEVQGIDPEVVVQVYDMRILLEEEAAGRAAERHSIGDVLQLEALVARDRKLENPDNATMVRTNLEFHETIWKATHTPVLIDLLKNLSKHLIHTPRSTLGEGDRWARSLDQHEQLVNAIRARDVDAARQTARQHFEEARAIRLEILRDVVASRTITDL
jgi:DNA-binding GntR family transcriptional regulator